MAEHALACCQLTRGEKMGIRTAHRSLIVAYLGVILITLIAMMWRPAPPARPFLVELSLALGLVGLVQLALQFVLIARFERVSVSYGVDAIMRFHRYVALVALVFVVAHPIILVLHEPAMAALLNPLYGDWGVRTANWAIYALILLVLLSLLRKQFRLSYEAWRVSHTLLGVATIVLSHVHPHLGPVHQRAVEGTPAHRHQHRGRRVAGVCEAGASSTAAPPAVPGERGSPRAR